MSNADLADFAPKEASRPSTPLGLIVAALAWGLVLAILALVVPKFEGIFQDFGIELSWMMKQVVQASRLWLAVLGLVVVLLVADSIVRGTLATRKDGERPARAWSALMVGLPFVVMAVLAVSIGATTIGLLAKLSG